MINILYEDNHILVVLKPVNIPVCEDESKDLDLLNMLKKYLKEKYDKKGNVYLGLVHRLDRPVSGVMVFAKTSKAASRLSKQVSNHILKKEYHAVVIGKLDKGRFEDKLLKNNKTNISKVDKNGKLAILDYESLKYDKKNNYSLVKINLKTGRSHQIRVQFSHHNHPLIGDNKYNNVEIKKIPVALFASSLTFNHPITNESLTFSYNLPDNYPWNLFK